MSDVTKLGKVERQLREDLVACFRDDSKGSAFFQAACIDLDIYNGVINGAIELADRDDVLREARLATFKKAAQRFAESVAHLDENTLSLLEQRHIIYILDHGGSSGEAQAQASAGLHGLISAAHWAAIYSPFAVGIKGPMRARSSVPSLVEMLALDYERIVGARPSPSLGGIFSKALQITLAAGNIDKTFAEKALGAILKRVGLTAPAPRRGPKKRIKN